MLEQYIQNDYLRSLMILFLVFAGLRIFVFIIEKVFVKFTARTKTDLDDLILDKSSKPITLLAFLIGFRIAIMELPLNENLNLIFSRIIFSFLILTLSWLFYSVAELLIFRGWKKFSLKTKSDLDDSLVNLIHGFLKTIWIIFTFIYVIDLWGIQIGPFLAGLGIGGIAVAFALQSSLSNIFGGISIILDKTVKIGDLIYLDDGTKGKIITIGLRSTKIKTFDNELIILPNSKLADSKVQNVTLPEPKSRVVIPFGISYGSNIDDVKKMVLEEIKKIKNISKEPKPIVKFLEMGDSALKLKTYFYVDSFEHRFDAIDEANTKIYNILNKNKIEIPFPQLDVHLRK